MFYHALSILFTDFYLATTPQLEGIRFRLEWILPIPLIVVTPFELAPGQGDTDPDVLGSKIRQVQRLIEAETQMLSASYKIAANSRSNSLMPIARRGSSVRRSSVVIKQVRELNEETVRRIETLRAQLQAFQHLQALYSAPFGVCLGIRGSERRLEIAFASNAARTSFLERIESMQRQSVKRFARSAKRMSLEKTSPSLDALDDDVSNEELEALTELIHQAIQRSGKGDATHIFAASQDYLAMTEDELMFLAGERVDVLAVLNDECWLCSCEGVIGVSAPRLILPLHEYGLDYIPQFRRSTYVENDIFCVFCCLFCPFLAFLLANFASMLILSAQDDKVCGKEPADRQARGAWRARRPRA